MSERVSATTNSVGVYLVSVDGLLFGTVSGNGHEVKTWISRFTDGWEFDGSARHLADAIVMLADEAERRMK